MYELFSVSNLRFLLCKMIDGEQKYYEKHTNRWVSNISDATHFLNDVSKHYVKDWIKENKCYSKFFIKD